MNSQRIEEVFQSELAVIDAVSMDWTPLETGNTTLHVSDPKVTKVLVVGTADIQIGLPTQL